MKNIIIAILAFLGIKAVDQISRPVMLMIKIVSWWIVALLFVKLLLPILITMWTILWTNTSEVLHLKELGQKIAEGCSCS